MTGSCNDASQPFAKTICSICYEDLKPIVEDLQAISICGHVFHELCIQQWFEYCSKGKKKCPICKQTCSASNVSRLYFQSVGDSNEPKLSQNLQTQKEDPEELKIECRRLEGKVKGLNSALESRENDLRNISNELCVCKEQLEKETSLKTEVLEQTRTVSRLLNLKTQELNKSDLERIKLQERNMALAKELAALKLMSDLNLNEEEIVKLASLGTHANSKENIDVLKKSLIVRNKMYKDLIAKCNTLGRDEARARKKLEKAKEKLEKLKTRIQEMETSNEIKDNELLRSLKASKNTNSCPNVLNAPEPCTPQSTIYASEAAIDDRKTKRFRCSENIDERNDKKDGVGGPTPEPAPEIYSYILIDDDDDDDDEKLKDDDVVAQDKSMPDITKETPLPFLDSQQGGGGGGGGEFCFSGGLLGPDGSKRHLGKWCKKGFNNNNKNASSAPMQASGDLIAVGSDGRGGTIKVLKSSSTDSRKSSVITKNGKLGAKTTSLQSRGIHHFFSKAAQ
ncbi:uncharacterized protein LOC111894641 isoform X2 [Lactuca sativa]|uniref:uncharacterized protein LOC111894641 isoform X2 n=1 Tax=Lactuca sativa TaxID=4236 RepID=UPI000CD9E4BC|nr:uncharacterized protein LOC111894641 isoform X2 [Lactuca sativa]